MVRMMKPQFDRLLALMLACFMAMVMVMNCYASAEETVVTPVEVSTEEPEAEVTASPTAEPTEVPMESTSPYKVVISAPSGWTGEDSVDVTVSISYLTGMGVSKAEYKQDGKWTDFTARLSTNSGGKVTVSVTANGMLTVRLTDPHGHSFDETADINCFDWSAPAVNAGIDGEELKIRATDSQSGVAGVQVNGLLFTTMDDGEISIIVKDVLSKYEHLAVRAFDYAGNFSEPVTLDNPYYEAPATATPVPTNTPKPTKASSSATSEATAAATTAAPANTTTSVSGSVVYVPEWTASNATATPTAEPVATPTPQVITETEYITLGPGMPYQSDGNAHTLDMLYSAATNKQFISIQTKSGNTFYLVIDYDKPVDEDAEMYETYFLNLVDERDLTDLLSDEDKESVPTATPQIVYVTPEPTAVPAATAVPETTDTNGSSQQTAAIALIAILAAAGVGVFLFMKNKNGSTKKKPDNDFGLDDDDEDENETQANE